MTEIRRKNFDQDPTQMDTFEDVSPRLRAFHWQQFVKRRIQGGNSTKNESKTLLLSDLRASRNDNNQYANTVTLIHDDIERDITDMESFLRGDICVKDTFLVRNYFDTEQNNRYMRIQHAFNLHATNLEYSLSLIELEEQREKYRKRYEKICSELQAMQAQHVDIEERKRAYDNAIQQLIDLDDDIEKDLT